MYSCTMTCRVADSATRETGGTNTMLKATIELLTPAPSDDAIAIASRIGRERVRHVHDPHQDRAGCPPHVGGQGTDIVPTTVAMMTGTIPAINDSWPP